MTVKPVKLSASGEFSFGQLVFLFLFLLLFFVVVVFVVVVAMIILSIRILSCFLLRDPPGRECSLPFWLKLLRLVDEIEMHAVVVCT